ncbi:MAG: indole-3-glycerol phosphate synthase TrpC [Gammaproteobacteria bacterium]|nr:indole-3-glycerol phosphate synthase TrpC [Gammaproteobacteria bacterium]
MAHVPDVLTKILAHKIEELSWRSTRLPLRDLRARLDDVASPRGFVAAIEASVGYGRAAVIAEIKKASPSKGVIRADYKPDEIARSYEHAGATCLSVLTDHEFFQGQDVHLKQARGACALPVLRKDFVLDSYHVYEARALGADCILLIVAALGDAQLTELSGLALDLDMDVLVEVHNEIELERALDLQLPLVGINNRNLHTFDTKLDTTLNLLSSIPDDRMVVTESGIHTPQDVALLRNHNVHVFLVGEAFMRAPDPGVKLAELFG